VSGVYGIIDNVDSGSMDNARERLRELAAVMRSQADDFEVLAEAKSEDFNEFCNRFGDTIAEHDRIYHTSISLASAPRFRLDLGMHVLVLEGQAAAVGVMDDGDRSCPAGAGR